MMWTCRIILIFLGLSLLVTGFSTFIRGLNNKPVSFLWGLYESKDVVKDTVIIVKQDTLYIKDTISNTFLQKKSDTGLAKTSTNLQDTKRSSTPVQKAIPTYVERSSSVRKPLEIEEPKKNEVQKNKDGQPSKYSIDGNFYGPTQVGDHNTQNLGLKPREVTQDILNDIQSLAKDKTTSISIQTRDNQPESLDYAAKMLKTLKELGYINTFMSGVTHDEQIYNGVIDIEHQKRISIKKEGDIISVVIPINH